MDELALRREWSETGAVVKAPPIRVPIKNHSLACSVALEDRGENVAGLVWFQQGASLPATNECQVFAYADGQLSTVQTFYMVSSGGESQRPFASFRVSGWKREVRAASSSSALFSVAMRITSDRDPEGDNGTLEVTFRRQTGEELRVESLDPSQAFSIFEGVVRGELFVPLADVTLNRRERRWHRARRRESFVLELADGSLIPVDPSAALLEHEECTRGAWSTLGDCFGAFLLFPDLREASGTEDELVLSARTVCRGDRVTVKGFARTRHESTYREAPRPEEILAHNIAVDDHVPRVRGELSPEERELYGVDDPPDFTTPSTERAPMLHVPSKSSGAPLAVLIGIGLIVLAMAARIYFKQTGESNAFTRAFDSPIEAREE